MGVTDGMVLGATKIVDSGPASQKFNLVLLSDGYRQAELGQFATDAQDFVDALFATPPFTDLALRCSINVYRVDVSSTDSGADDPATATCPGTGAVAATYLDATFCGNGAIRRLLTVNNGTALNVLNAQVPEWHQAIVIVNSSTYGGSGGQIGVTSTSGAWEPIAIHEMGHAAFGLADEYEYYAGCGIDVGQDNYAGGEPGQPNVTIDANRATIKWGDLIAAATPVPTTSNADCTQCDPQPTPVPAGTVGAFEGGRYFHCGIYRPEFNCMMRVLSAEFCAVCQRRIRETLAPFGPATDDEKLELISSFESLLHSFEELLRAQPCPDVQLLKSFESLLHSFERMLHDRQRKRGVLEKKLLLSFECLLHSFENLLDRVLGLKPSPIPDYCNGGDKPQGMPDLIPIAPFPPPPPNDPLALPQNFCVSEAGGPRADTLHIIVRNQGDAPAGASTTVVQFGNNPPINLPTAALAQAGQPGSEQLLVTRIPRGCFLGEFACEFTITVDADNVIAESNEANNVASSFCPGIVS